MLFSELALAIGQEYICGDPHVAAEMEVADISLLGGETGPYTPGTLYIGQLSQLKNPSFPPNLIFWGEGEPEGLASVNYARIREEDFSAVFNTAKRELFRSLRMENQYAMMLKMILDGRSLSEILDVAAEKMGNPLAVLDISGKLIAHSTPFGVPDPLWQESVAQGYCCYEFMEHIKQLRESKPKPNSPEAFVSVCETNHIVYLCSKILEREALLGYVFMFEVDAPICRQSREFLPILSRAAGEMIVRSQDSAGLRAGLYRNILADMLAGIDPGHVKVRIQVSNLEFPEHMCALIVRPSYYHGENYLRGELTGKLLAIFEKAPSLCYQGGVTLIVPLDGQYRLDGGERRALEELAVREHLQIGVSNGSSQPSQFAAHYAQAEEALRYAQRLGWGGTLHEYQRCAFYALLSALPMGTRLGRFCHPALGRLRKYDHENGTELYQTLRVYTETGLNQRRTSELLFLHRNTLNYRMRRICEIGGIRFDDPEILFLLMYSFQIDRFLENESV